MTDETDNHLQAMQEHLREMLIANGVRPRTLARAAGLGETVVRDFLKGHTNDLRIGTVYKLARAMGTPISMLLPIPELQQAGPLMPVKGEVAAGVWKQAMEWPEDEWDWFVGRASRRDTFTRSDRFGLRVTGDSMNMVYPDGSVVECELIDNLDSVHPGQRVIVVRQRVDGDVEATVKEFARDPSGKPWLLPRSTNPNFQTPIALHEPEDDEIVEVRVIARVIGSYRPE